MSTPMGKGLGMPNCAQCGEPDKVGTMTAVCQKCDRWYHGPCVGISDEIPLGSWTCSSCTAATTKSEKAKSVKSTQSGRSNRLQLELMRLEEEKQARRERILEKHEHDRQREEQILKEKVELELQYIREKYNLLKADTLDAEEGSCYSTNSRVMKWVTTQINHEDMRDHRESNDSIAPAHTPSTAYHSTSVPVPDSLNERSDLAGRSTVFASNLYVAPQSNVVDSRGVNAGAANPHMYYTQMNGWLPAANQSANVFNNQSLPYPTQLQQPVVSQMDPRYLQQFMMPQQCVPPQHVGIHHGYQQTPGNVPPHGWPQQQVPSPPVPPPALPTYSAGRQTGPYRHFAARQVVPKELPVFDGNPEDWPLFISSYRNSTEMCGFSDAENLMRLQKCLRGKALNAVRSMLLLPTAVPQVLEQLQITFGNPEKLVHALVAKVEKTPAPKADDLAGLANLGTVVQNLVGFLKAANQENHLANPTVLDTLVQKLPPSIRINWGIMKATAGDVTLDTFNNFLKVICKAAMDVTPYSEETDKTKAQRIEKPKLKEKGFINAHVADENGKKAEHKIDGTMVKTLQKSTIQDKPCYTCQKVGHRVRECFKFKSLSLSERWKAMEKHQLCQKCLVPHGKWSCKATRACDVSGCSDGHHTLLHPGKPNTESGDSSKTAVVSVHRQPQNSVLFRIVPVVLYGKDVQIKTFAFLDEGSSLTLMDTEIANQLNVQGEHKPLCLKWTSNVTRDEANSQQLTLEISGSRKEQRFTLRDVRTVERLDLPLQTLRYELLAKRFPHLQNLPVESYESAAPRVLIGLNNLQLAVPLKRRVGQGDEPIAAKTKLGWTICGNINTGSSSNHTFHICECKGDQSLHELVKGYFAFDNLGINGRNTPEAAEDIRAKTILRDTTVKCADGHFETGLLWRYDYVELPPSHDMAVRRLHCLERRLQKNPELRANFDKQIAEYQRKGYAHKATKQELEMADEKRVWYLPLGIVINPKKPDRVRIFWDAKAMVNGVSLNSMLLKGPDMLAALRKVLHIFRQRQFCATGDVEEMYHQVRIRASDRSSQRFLYRSDPTQPPEVYIMDVATFGSACSPCSAQYIKNINADQWREEYPEAATAIVENHYVDDYLDSRDTEEEMASVARDVRTVHAKAGFNIRKWMSNSTEVLHRVGEDPSSTNEVFIVDKSHKMERVLGMSWHPKTDVFSFSLMLPDDLQQLVSGNKTVTKRDVLRLVMTLFDPHGFIAHFLIHGKILIRDLWRSGVSWDEPIPQEIHERWARWISLLSDLVTVQVPRCYFPGYDPESYKTLELHIFVDASEIAYASVAYFRIIDRDQIRCALVSAKAKVAPLRSTSIPRLELEATRMGSRLAKTIIEDHTIPVVRTIIWTDSTTVLCWIRSDSRKYKQYIGVRIGEILENADVSNFRWVPTKLNVADDATKWAKGPNLEPNSRWFTGPEFLSLPEQYWPQQNVPVTETREELRAVHVHQEHLEENHNEIIDCSRFSKWERLLRTMAYVYHFIDLCRRPARERRNVLVQEDFIRAERALWREAQMAKYADELEDLALTRRPSRMDKSPLRKLSPFLDEHGVIRMEGRIGASPFADYDAKYPIILPKKHPVTLLLIDWYHRKQGHAFGETVVNQMRQKFHISNLRIVTRKAKHWCQWCKIHKATPQIPRMAPLPEARLIAHERVFTRVGIDYFGPMAIKIGRAQVKRWVALFTCLASRAVHLEVVASLSTESCKLAIRRFIARRGAPAEIYTDNGTNFLGASRELTEQISAVLTGLAETFTNADTKWYFIPPAAPHMGGVWERMVRSVKAAMMSLSKLGTPTEEVFQTVVAEAESMINSRPLTYIPLATADEEALTPNHLIMLSSKGVKQPTKQPTSAANALKSGYHLAQRMLDHFWRKWIEEFMPTIARRTKWFKDVKQIAVGDLVVIVDEKVRNSWTRGRVVRLLPGPDGRVRQADVLTGDRKVNLCAVANLAVLDVVQNGNAGDPEQRHGVGNVGTQSTDAHDLQQPTCSRPVNIDDLVHPDQCHPDELDSSSDSD